MAQRKTSTSAAIDTIELADTRAIDRAYAAWKALVKRAEGLRKDGITRRSRAIDLGKLIPGKSRKRVSLKRAGLARSRRRDKTINLRMTPESFIALTYAADLKRVSRMQYVRDAVRLAMLYSCPPEMLPAPEYW